MDRLATGLEHYPCSGSGALCRAAVAATSFVLDIREKWTVAFPLTSCAPAVILQIKQYRERQLPSDPILLHITALQTVYKLQADRKVT